MLSMLKAGGGLENAASQLCINNAFDSDQVSAGAQGFILLL